MKKTIKKILKVVDENCFLILSVMTAIVAVSKGDSNEAKYLYLFALGELILQSLTIVIRKIDNIKTKLLDMSEFHDECELLNVQVLTGLHKAILKKNKVEEEK